MNQALPRLTGSHQGSRREAQTQEEGLQSLNTKEKQDTFIFVTVMLFHILLY